MYKWILFSAMLSANAYAVDFQPYIVNGSDTSSATYPSFASLLYQSSAQYSTNSFCGASIINSQFILTAAHCIYGKKDTMLYTVVVPQLDNVADFPYGNIQISRAAAFYYPSTYINSSSALWRDDIAIIKLETPLNVADYSALLNTQLNNDYPAGNNYKAIGHGYVAGNVPNANKQLQETTLTFVSNAVCSAFYGSALTSKQICFDGAVSGAYKNSTCSGDSGGPIYWFNGSQYIQIGLTSFGPSLCGDTNQPITSVFTELYDYQSWIQRVLTGAEVPKYYVATQNGVRVLIDTQTVAPQEESGGSLSILGLTLLLLFRFRAHNNFGSSVVVIKNLLGSQRHLLCGDSVCRLLYVKQRIDAVPVQ